MDCIDSLNNYEITGIIQELRNLIEFFSSFLRSPESYCVTKSSLSLRGGSMLYGLVHIRRLHGA